MSIKRGDGREIAATAGNEARARAGEDRRRVSDGQPLSARWQAREQARMRLAQLRLAEEESLERAFARAAAIGARALEVDRVGIWLFDPEHAHLRCAYQLDRTAAAGETGATLRIRDLGGYEKALRERRVVAVEDVAREPLTAAMLETYFRPRALSSTLDVPLYRAGKIAGVVCHEHRGAPRRWTDDEAAFGVSVADVVGAILLASDLRAAEAALRDHEHALHDALKADALARVARGVAHDLQNTLAVVFAEGELLARRANDPGAVRESGARLLEAAQSATRLVAQLRTYAREGHTPREPILVDEVLQRFAPTLGLLVGAERSVEFESDAGRSTVLIDPVQLEQVLSNLVVNARDATEPGATITVRVRSALGALEAPSPAIVIEVQDRGRGMDEATQSRIFEPYFSTKAEQHSGLGLAIVQGIVEGAGGMVEVESAPGEGTTMRVALPRADVV